MVNDLMQVKILRHPPPPEWIPDEDGLQPQGKRFS
jgi:hypothetical protein